MGAGPFPGVKCGRGVLLTTHPPSRAAVMEEQSYTSTHPVGHTGPVTGSLYLYLSIDISERNGKNIKQNETTRRKTKHHN